MPKAFLQLIEQTVKLIRSKGVGIYFVTQSPSDIPDPVLAQLSNRVQHALRAYTPAEQKAVRTAAQTFRVNPDFKTEDAIMNLGTGEALTSFLDAKGVPQIVQYTKIICPQSGMCAIDDNMRQQIIRNSSIYGKYDRQIDRQSAYEDLQRITAAEQLPQPSTVWQPTTTTRQSRPYTAPRQTYTQPRRTTTTRRSSSSPINPLANTIGREVGKSLVRGLMGLLTGK